MKLLVVHRTNQHRIVTAFPLSTLAPTLTGLLMVSVCFNLLAATCDIVSLLLQYCNER